MVPTLHVAEGVAAGVIAQVSATFERFSPFNAVVVMVEVAVPGGVTAAGNNADAII
jgi:hypothetical protein